MHNNTTSYTIARNCFMYFHVVFTGLFRLDNARSCNGKC
nr:MAG TPA: hypothetical protein [Caudoviricetes sp.]